MKLPPEMVKLAQHIIRTKSGEFDPSLLEDHYRNALVRIRRNILPVAPRTERALLTAATYGSERRSYWRSPKLDYFGRDERRRVLNERKVLVVALAVRCPCKSGAKKALAHIAMKTILAPKSTALKA
jgi:hypothetical protein